MGQGLPGARRPGHRGDLLLISAATIGGALAASGRFVGPAWRHAWAALLLASLATAFWVWVTLVPESAHWQPAVFLIVLASWLLAQGALWRRVLDQGDGGLRLGMGELRLLTTWFLAAAFLFIIGLLFFVVVLGFAYAAAASGKGFVAADVATWAGAVDSRGRIVVSIVGLAAAVALVWAAIRISLAPAATMASARVRMLETWPLTRGLVWRILAGQGVIGLGPMALWLWSGRFVRSTPLKASVAIGLSGLNGLVVAGLWLPLGVGLMAYFYRASTAKLET